MKQTVSKEVLLQWFETLDVENLQKAWDLWVKRKRFVKRNARDRALEKQLLLFSETYKRPTENDWFRFAQYLKQVSIYSRSTYDWDIVQRLKKLLMKLKK